MPKATKQEAAQVTPPAPKVETPKVEVPKAPAPKADRKSTRLNSSHTVISYAVFCLKKKKRHDENMRTQSNKAGHRLIVVTQ